MNSSTDFTKLFQCSPDSVVLRTLNDERDERGKRKATYRTIRRGISQADIEAHLAGKVCIVAKPDLPGDLCMWAMIDHDIYMDDAKKQEIKKEIETLHLPLHPFSSKSGGIHHGIFFKTPVKTDTARELLGKWAAQLGDPNAEIFPKKVSKDKIPFGIALPFFGEPGQFQTFTPVLYDLPSNGDSTPKGSIDVACINQGQRNSSLASLAGTMRNRGMGENAIEAALLAENVVRCVPPLPENEVRSIARSVARYPAPPACRPEIRVDAGKAPEATDQAEEILLEHSKDLKIYQRSGELVKIIKLPVARKDSRLNRPAGTIMLESLSQAALLETFDRLVDFKRFNEKKQQYLSTDCPTRVVSSYLSRRGSWKLPVLTGVISAPLLRLDGTVLNSEGYDDDTGLFLESMGGWLEVPAMPDLKDAEKSLEILKEPFAEFPFVDGAAVTVAIAAILTAIQRRLLAACPLFGYSAPTPRTGKSKLAEAVAIIATGKIAPASTASPDQEEFRKALTATLREGHLIVNLDNVEHAMKSPDLCKILTQAEYGDRLLGESKQLYLPTNVLWTATGNNLIFRGDLATRVLLCSIDAGEEHPEHRRFKIPNLEAYLLEHRAALVAAALTILRAFHVAGCPKQEVEEWGGFEEWSSFIREPLIWSGMDDPCLTREKVLAEDPEKESSVEALTQLLRVFGAGVFTVKEVVAQANFEKGIGGYKDELLHDALAIATGCQRDINQAKLGQWFKVWRDRFAGGLRLQRANAENTNPAKWQIVGKKV